MGTSDRLKGARVLVVEDDRDTREIVQFILEQNGAIVASADSVPRALEVYPTFGANVIVADIGMPEYNGYALIAQIREDEAKLDRFTPAIALTAYTSPADRTQALSAGFQEYMAKPFDPGDLIVAIARLLGIPVAETKEPAA